jgi:zinc protease
MRRPLLLALCAAALLAVPSPAPAQVEAAASIRVPRIEFEKYVLPNGLEVILHRDASLPLVAVNLWYHVGPAEEPRGRSGFAHLFEHLMFEGSKHVGKRLDPLLEAAGASNANGSTSWDRTNYFETVPREYLELVLWLESDRMGFLVDMLTQTRLDVQRDVVLNERRQSYENAPYGPSSLALLDALFPPGHPYHGAIIGSPEDLASARLADARAFHAAYYAPSNATLVIAGDFDDAQARQWVQKYFGTLPTRPAPKRRRDVTPPLAKATRAVVPEPVELAKVSLAWITPPAYTSDDVALDLTTVVLATGKASRLYRTLVTERQLAAEVEAYVDSNQLCSSVVVSATAATGKSPEEVEQALWAELARLAQSGPTPAELARAKRRRLVDLMSDLQQLNGPGGESGRAGLLQRFNHYLGDPGYLETLVRKVEQTSAPDVQRAVSQYLARGACATVITMPKGDHP